MFHALSLIVRVFIAGRVIFATHPAMLVSQPKPLHLKQDIMRVFLDGFTPTMVLGSYSRRDIGHGYTDIIQRTMYSYRVEDDGVGLIPYDGVETPNNRAYFVLLELYSATRSLLYGQLTFFFPLWYTDRTSPRTRLLTAR